MKIEVYSPTIRRKEMDAVLTALVEDRVGPGEQSGLLIKIAKEYLGFDYCLALRSPALALSLALRALNLEPGKGVVVSYLSPRYYDRVIRDLGLLPVYCDVQPSSPVMGRATVEAVLQARPGGVDPRCVVLHHTLGFLPASLGIAELGLPLIEDCSQSFGCRIEPGGGAGGEGSPAPAPAPSPPPGPMGEGASEERKTFRGLGGAGVFAILGLEARDVLTSGGGALLYAMNRREGGVLRNYGTLPPEYGIPDMNAAMAVVQFREAIKNLRKRGVIAGQYLQAALRTRHRRLVLEDGVEYNNYAFPLALESGVKDVKAYAKKKDIAVESAFESTIAGAALAAEAEAEGQERQGEEQAQDGGAKHPAWCQEAYSLALRTVLFPLYPRLGASEIERVARLIQTIP